MEMKKGLHGKEIYEAKKDPQFQKPYVDVDEWKERELPDGTKVPYRYVHGGFEDTGVKFLFCFPEQDEFKGRFFHYLSPFRVRTKKWLRWCTRASLTVSRSVC